MDKQTDGQMGQLKNIMPSPTVSGDEGMKTWNRHNTHLEQLAEPPGADCRTTDQNSAQWRRQMTAAEPDSRTISNNIGTEWCLKFNFTI